MAQIDIGVDSDGDPEDPELAEAVEQADADYESPMAGEAEASDAFDLGSILGRPGDDQTRTRASADFSRSRRRGSTGSGTQGREEAREEPSGEHEETESKPDPKFGFPIPPGLKELFTPKGFGTIMSEGISGFYKVVGSPELDADEKKLTATVWAFYAQARFPQDWTWAQPEVILVIGNLMHLLKYDRAERAGDRIGKGVNRMIDWWTSEDRFWRSWFRKRPARTSDNA